MKAHIINSVDVRASARTAQMTSIFPERMSIKEVIGAAATGAAGALPL